MATAILLAREVIAKFFGQNTGIKQNMEKIESHPTIIVCPFLSQCDRPGVPQKIIVKLKGAAKHAQSSYEGIYNLGTNLVNAKAYWIQEGGSKALWNDKKTKHWRIGKSKHLGNSSGHRIYSPDKAVGPLEATTWKYYKKYTFGKHGWIKAGADIVIAQGTYFDTVFKGRLQV